MKITQSDDPFFQKLPPLSKQERIDLLERRKMSILHEMKIVAERIFNMIKAGLVSDADSADNGDQSKFKDCPKIPSSDKRYLLTKDPVQQKQVLHTFARFSNLKDIFNSSILLELKKLQTPDEPKK